jgi:hypothetical protein
VKLTDKDRMWLADLRAEQMAEGIDFSGVPDEELAQGSWFAYYRMERAKQEVKQAFRQAFLDLLPARLARWLERR